jgi:phage shock protein PspC (stress-responsive transcriptional regulator)
MKKIININLSGRVIPIEDAAYEKLQAYIETLRRFFAQEEGRDEIINDIESRIAELMSEKIRKGADAIADSDLDEIIASMGRPEDFEAAENEAFSSSSTSGQQKQAATEEPKPSGRRSRRLSRNMDDKILGGVCSGVANYLNVDPAIVRILFAIITFGGFGLGFLVYFIMWAILPAAPLTGFSGKRLFRNPEDRIFGGVASGLSAYFNKETWVIRLVFAAPFLINILFSFLSWPFFHDGALVPNIVFGSVTSTFILVYIILWIVLPEARSDYERMEMRGEKVDVNTIRQNVKERTREFTEEVKSTAANLSGRAKEFAGTRGREFATEVRETARRTGSGIGHVIGVLFKAFFLLIAGSIAFGLLVALMGLIFGGIGLWPVKNFILNGFWQNVFAWGTLLFFLIVPLVAFITWLIRRMMRIRSRNHYLGWTFGGLWTLGWICVALFVASMLNDFRMNNSHKEPAEMAITQPAKGRMIIQVSEPAIEYSGSFPWINIEGRGLDITADSLKMANVKVRVEQSRDSFYHVEIKKYAHGENMNEADNRAQRIQFHANYMDSVLDVGSGITIDKDSKFRAQEVVVIVSIPVGKKVRFDESINKLGSVRTRTGGYKRWGRYNNNDDINWDEYFDYDTDVDYVMGKDGLLFNPEKPKKTNNEPEQSDSLERKTRKLELEQQIKEIEKQEKIDSLRRKLDAAKEETMEDSKDEEGDPVTVNYLPGFSMVRLLN